MFARLGTGLLTLAIACCGLAQSGQPIKIEFLSEAEREVWTGPSDSTDVPADRTPVSGKATEFPVPSDHAGQSLFVHDVTTGAVAAKPLDQASKTGVWKVSPADFKLAFSLDFFVSSQGQPATAASLRLSGAGGDRQALLTSADRGLVRFYLLPPGDVRLIVEYRSGSGTKSLPPQTFSVKVGARQDRPHSITLTDADVVTPEAGQASGGTEGAKPGPAPKTEPSNPIVTALNVIVGLLVVAAIAYGVYSYIRHNPKQLDDALKKVGLQTAQDDPDPATAHAGPQPIKKIILEDADPTAVSTPGAPAGVPVVANPRLVRPDGGIFLLLDGPSQVGREPGLQVSLEGESTVSRSHAELVRTGDIVVLRDLGSTNGTFVNGAKLAGEVTLSPGDTVQFGAVSLRFEA